MSNITPVTNQIPEAIIVLGNDSGENKLSDIAISRVDKAIEIYKKHKVNILFSGRYSLKHEASDPGYRESSLMKEYAIKQGIPEKDILIEDNSRETLGNAYFSKQIVKSHSWTKIIIVSSEFHLRKAKLMFDFVYGPNYNLYYAPVKDKPVSNEQLEKMKEWEKNAKAGFMNAISERSIRIGEDEKIGILLKEFYIKIDKEGYLNQNY